MLSRSAACSAASSLASFLSMSLFAFSVALLVAISAACSKVIRPSWYCFQRYAVRLSFITHSGAPALIASILFSRLLVASALIWFAMLLYFMFFLPSYIKMFFFCSFSLYPVRRCVLAPSGCSSRGLLFAVVLIISVYTYISRWNNA